MKFSKHLFLLIFALFLFTKLFSQGHAFQKSNGTFVIKTDILLPVMSLFNIGDFLEHSKPNFSITFEKFLKKKSSLSLQLTIMNASPKLRHVGNWHSTDAIIFTENILEIIPEYKIYLFRKKMQKGFYIGAYAKYIRNHTINEEPGPYYNLMTYLEYVEHETAFGGLTGYQFYIKKRLVIDFLLGFGRAQLFKLDIIKEENVHFIDDYSGYLDAQLAINIGYKF